MLKVLAAVLAVLSAAISITIYTATLPAIQKQAADNAAAIEQLQSGGGVVLYKHSIFIDSSDMDMSVDVINTYEENATGDNEVFLKFISNSISFNNPIIENHPVTFSIINPEDLQFVLLYYGQDVTGLILLTNENGSLACNITDTVTEL